MVASRPNTGSNVDIAKLPLLSRKTGKILGFLIVYRLYIRIRMRDAVVEEQI